MNQPETNNPKGIGSITEADLDVHPSEIEAKLNQQDMPFTKEMFDQHINDSIHLTTDVNNDNLFKTHTGDEWLEIAKKRPTPKMLFGEFWFEDELCILFADTNLGKSILAVQIGDSISRGEPINGFRLEANRQPVLYFDFELTDKQFENRYSNNFKWHYSFDPNFMRSEINHDADIDYYSFEQYLFESLEQLICKTQAKVLIIDNITYLKNETENARNALPLMKHLKTLKSKYNLSLLVLAHTPKGCFDFFLHFRKRKGDMQG